MHTVMITGASGFVGGRLAAVLAPGRQLLTPGRQELDIQDEQAVQRYLGQHRPDVIFHAAALSNTGYCQQHPDKSWQTNVLGAEYLARAARKTGAKLVFFSSDQVYAGSKVQGPHTEQELLNPSNVYGAHKLEAERRVLAADPDAVCLRASWMYDLPVQGLRTNTGILGNLYKAAITGVPLARNPEERRGITWVGLLVNQAEKLAALPGGVYNAGCENNLDSVQTARQMACLLGLAENIVAAQQQPGRCLSMEGSRLQKQGVLLGNTIDGLRACLAAYGMNQE